MEKLSRSRSLSHAFVLALLAPLGASLPAQCPEEPPLQGSTGESRVTCPCFAAGEEAGVVLEALPEDYPIEVLRVGIAWASAAGGNVPSLEGAIHVFSKGLPDPGVPVFQLQGPVLEDGFLNEFTLSPPIRIASGPFTVSLQFANANAGNLLAPSVVHDGNGCRPNKNVVLAQGLGWVDACALGVTGDWVMEVVYRRAECPPPPPPEPRFIRGDDNQDGAVDISDPLYSLSHLFLGGPRLCLEAMDTNDDGQLDLSDPVYNLSALFMGGPLPPPPYPSCNQDPAPPTLGCAKPGACG
jgi:hypothetical protein